MHTIAPSELVKWLRAAGEPSRLRLLTLCAEGALSVSDLSRALKQSEPRVSRHLKILCEAGLVERLRQGQWVHYRVSAGAEAASFVRGLLAQVDRRDALLLRDRAAAHAGTLAHAGGAESRLGRALAELLRAAGLRETEGPVLLVGVDHPELLEAAAGAGHACTALAHSRRAAQGARAHAERRGLACRVLQARDGTGPDQDDFARAGSGFGLVLLDHPAAGAALPRLLAQARRRAGRRAGTCGCSKRYDALESAGARVVEHPLARLRRLLSDAGLECERISPVEADGDTRAGGAGARRRRQRAPRPARRQPPMSQHLPSVPLSVSFEFFPPADAAMEATLWNSVERLAPLAPRFVSVTYGADGSTRERTHNVVTRIQQRDRAHRRAASDLRRRLARRDPRHRARLLGPGHPPPGGAARRPAARAAGLHAAPRRLRLRLGPGGGTGRAGAVRHFRGGLSGGASRGALGGGRSRQPASARSTPARPRAITQFFYDSDAFLRFRDRCAAAGIRAPIVPGILPITRFPQVLRFARALRHQHPVLAAASASPDSRMTTTPGA